jgi:hypothetical protein
MSTKIYDLPDDIGTCSISMRTKENTVIIRYNPTKMLHSYNLPGDNERYEETLEHIKRRTDWCVRKSAGQNPDINEYPQLPPA